MHFMGDETLSIPRPHGNCMRQTRISTRSKSSVSKKIEDSVMGNSDKLSLNVYQNTVTEDQSVTYKPRNVHYIRENSRTEERPTKDAISNLQAMAFEDEGFIHYIATYPNLVCIA